MKKSMMYFKFIVLLLASFFPEFALADVSTPMDFAPPPSDVSVTFLTNIFGTVDGVLYGGNQILGSMFAVFNAAVLSIGGMILVYTIVVATINTAGEGKLLGKTWSSIWIPIRTTMGISLLFTYSSGYSVLQVMVMWVVVQGVGAADLIWNAALGYLQRGGVIVAPLTSATNYSTSSNTSIIGGAGYITAGTTCMAALQQQLNTLQATYLANPSGACSNLPTNGSGTSYQNQMITFCQNPVPDFLSSVDIMGANEAALETCMPNGTWDSTVCSGTTSTTAYTAPGPTSSISVPMPNFTSSNAPEGYADLNGICGTLTWNMMGESTVESSGSTLGMSDTEMASMSLSRATAVNQMYSDLSSVASSIVQNDLTLYGTQSTCSGSSGAGCYFSSTYYTAAAPLGVPAPVSGFTSTMPPCTNSSTCTNWVSPSTGFAPVLNGTEYQGAVSDYNSIMNPTLNALYNANSIAKNSSFIDNAEEQGWIMAGSYFFNLSNLNQTSQGSYTDTSSGLGGSYPPGISSGSFCSFNTSSPLCTWYAGGNPSSNSSYVTTYNNQIEYLIEGPAADGSTAIAPSYSQTWPTFYLQESNATAYGYSDNASNVTIAGQQGSTSSASFMVPVSVITNMSKVSAGGCTWSLFSGNVCTIIQGGVVNIINAIINMIMSAIEAIFMIIVFVPMAAFSMLFVEAAQMMNNSVNSVLSLAAMGNLFINTTVTLMVGISIGTVAASAAVITFPVVAAVLLTAGPFLMAWFGMILAMGVMLAYYIPMLPYLLYTFAGLGWMIGVLEAMVAAPIVALGVSLPEGDHDVFGKGIHALMLILNAFLRPAMIVIAYIAAMIISTVGVWLINTGFGHFQSSFLSTATQTNWTLLLVNFFLFFMYVTMCVGVVNTSFDLIYKMPEQILKWIGGANTAGGLGSDAAAGMSGKLEQANKEGGQAVSSGATAKRSFGKEGGEGKGKDSGGAKAGGGKDSAQIHSDGGNSTSSGGMMGSSKTGGDNPSWLKE